MCWRTVVCLTAVVAFSGCSDEPATGPDTHKLPAGTPTLAATLGPWFTSPTAGGWHSCVRSHATYTGPATTLCWGRNTFGQVGNGTTATVLRPTPILSDPGLVVVDAGNEFTCGIQSTFTSNTTFPPGAVYCWGANSYGQLGNGTGASSSRPTLVTGGVRFLSISVGDYHACGLDNLGVAYCWGRGVEGQLGTGNTLNQLKPTPVSTAIKWKQIVAGGYHTCGLRGSDGAVFCWGRGTEGQLGAGNKNSRSTPGAAAGTVFKRLALGRFHTCGTRGLTSPFVVEDLAWCWGSDQYGALGTNCCSQPFVPNGPLLDTPHQVKGNLRYRYITAGQSHTCGVIEAPAYNRLYCWGRGTEAQLGNGLFVNRLEPYPVYGPSLYVEFVSGGISHTIARETNGRIDTWGDNTFGQLGNGTTNTASTPITVLIP